MAGADKKITDLPELTTADTSDVLPIVDSSAGITKRVAISGLTAGVLTPGSVTTDALAESAVTVDKVNWGTFQAFRATRSATLSVGSQTQVDVKYDNVLYNVGSAYDSSTGLFTAARDGVYQFSFGLWLEGANISRGMYFFRGTVPSVRTGGDRTTDITATGGNFNRLNQSIEVPMKQGETFGLTVFIDVATDIANPSGGTFFAGHFVSSLPSGAIS